MLICDDEDDNAASTSGLQNMVVNDSVTMVTDKLIKSNTATAVTTDSDNNHDTDKSSKTEDTPETEKDGGFADIFAAESETGGTIRQDVAVTLGKALVNPYDEKKVQEAMNKVKVPTNCPSLIAPKVNLQIWSNIQPKTRSVDLKLQRVQKPLVKGLTALAKLDEKQPLTKDMKEAFLLLSVANFELNCVRREMIKPNLNPEFHHLCSTKNKTTEWLFGDDLGKQCKDLQEESKATRGVMRGGSSNRGRGTGRFRPYPKFNQSFHAAAAAAGWTKNSSSFLGQRGNQSQQQQCPLQWQKQNRHRPNTTNLGAAQMKNLNQQKKGNANLKK